MLTVTGVPAKDILRNLPGPDREGACIFHAYGGEAIVNRYYSGAWLNVWRWGYQANCANGSVSACGPFLFRCTAKRDAMRELRTNQGEKDGKD